MADYEKVLRLCDKLTRGNGDKYPNALKSLLGISDETKEILLRVIRKYQTNHANTESGYIESELIHRFLLPSPFLRSKIYIVE